MKQGDDEVGVQRIVISGHLSQNPRKALKINGLRPLARSARGMPGTPLQHRPNPNPDKPYSNNIFEVECCLSRLSQNENRRRDGSLHVVQNPTGADLFSE